MTVSNFSNRTENIKSQDMRNLFIIILWHVFILNEMLHNYAIKH